MCRLPFCEPAILLAGVWGGGGTSLQFACALCVGKGLRAEGAGTYPFNCYCGARFFGDSLWIISEFSSLGKSVVFKFNDIDASYYSI